MLEGGRVKGLMHVIEGVRPAAGGGPVIVAEGYATAASLHHATGLETAVAFNAGNLEAVARAIRKQHPERTIVIAADDDHTLEAQGKKNVGLEKARAAAKAVGGSVMQPVLTDEDRAAGLTDFNDVERTHGPQSLRHAMSQAVQKAPGAEERLDKGAESPGLPGESRTSRDNSQNKTRSKTRSKTREAGMSL